MCENTDNECVFLVPLFCFKCDGNVCPIRLRRTCLSLQLVVCFCSVVRRSVYTSARAFFRDAQIALACGLTCGSRFQGCVVRTKEVPSPRHPCLHLRISLALTLHLLTLTSSFSILSSRTTSQVTSPINKHCAAPPLEEFGSFWLKLPLPQVLSPT